MVFVATLRDLIQLTVPEFIPMGLTALIAGLVFSSHSFLPSINLLLALLSVVFVIAGYNSFNAIADKEIDGINKPFRPIPRKVISLKQALYASILFFSASLFLAFLINLVFFTVIVFTTLIAVLYSFPAVNLKRRFVLGTLSANLLYTVLFPLAGWALTPSNPVPWELVSFLFFFGLGSAVLKDFEDVPGDIRYNARTLPAVLGYSEAIVFVFSSFLFSLVLLAFFIISNSLPIKYSLIAGPVVLALGNAYHLYHKRSQDVAKTSFKIGLVILMITEIGFALLAVAG